MICQKCLTSRSGDVIGNKCRTPGCDGVIEESQSLQDVTDELPEPMTCPRRVQDMGPWKYEKGLDRWRKHKSNGNRICSFCGSLHFEDFAALVKVCGDAPITAPFGSVPEIELSDKPYKVYVHQPGIRNAMEGGIKFYMHHVPRDEKDKILVTPEQNEEYAHAISVSKKRFETAFRTEGQITKGFQF